MKQLRLIVIVCILGVLVNGCGVFIPLAKNTNKLSKLSLNMTTEEVKEAIGEPDEVRGALNQTVTWQYNLYNKSDAIETFGAGFFLLTISWWIPPPSQSYWLYFQNGRLTQWGRAGDWKEYDKTQKIDLNIKNR